MSGPSLYDTPPDGDFARYVEALGQASVERLLRQQGATDAAFTALASGASKPVQGPPRHAHRVPTGRAAPPVVESKPSTLTVASVLALAPVRQVLQRAVLLGFGYLVLSLWFPWLAFMGWPLLLYFMAYAMVRLRRLPWTEWAQHAARRAASFSPRQP